MLNSLIQLSILSKIQITFSSPEKTFDFLKRNTEKKNCRSLGPKISIVRHFSKKICSLSSKSWLVVLYFWLEFDKWFFIRLSFIGPYCVYESTESDSFEVRITYLTFSNGNNQHKSGFKGYKKPVLNTYQIMITTYLSKPEISVKSVELSSLAIVWLFWSKFVTCRASEKAKKVTLSQKARRESFCHRSTQE